MTVIRSRAVRSCLVLAAVCIGQASPGLAWPPISRGEQSVQMGQTACMQRAVQVFQALGWTDIAAHGPGLLYAHKASHSSYITCNDLGNGYSFVNVFVASDGGPGEVPGAERVALQQAIAGQIAATPTPAVQCGGLRVDKLGSNAVRVSWTNAQMDGDDWFTIVPSGSADNYYTTPRRPGVPTGSLDWSGLSPGNWEYRWYLDNGYSVAGRCPFTIP